MNVMAKYAPVPPALIILFSHFTIYVCYFAYYLSNFDPVALSQLN